MSQFSQVPNFLVGNAVEVLNEIKTKADEVKVNVDSAVSNVSTLQTEASQLRIDVDNHSGEISTLQGQASSLDARVGGAETNITALQSSEATNSSNISTLQGQASSLDTRLSAAEGDISTVQTDVSSLDTRLTTAESDIVSLQVQRGKIWSYYPTGLDLTPVPFSAETDAFYHISGTLGYTNQWGIDNLSAYQYSLHATNFIQITPQAYARKIAITLNFSVGMKYAGHYYAVVRNNSTGSTYDNIKFTQHVNDEQASFSVLGYENLGENSGCDIMVMFFTDIPNNEVVVHRKNCKVVDIPN